RSHVRFPNVVVDDAALAEAIGRIQGEMDHANSALERQSLLLDLLGALITRHSSTEVTWRGSKAESAPIRQVKQYLQAHYADNVRLESLSEMTGLSPFHLLRTFRRSIGMPPHTYLRQVRVEHAKRMLCAGVPIAQVALSTGFTDQSHLTRFF